jgi:glycine/D-amino acid oxidase-like deaminating enzyme
VVSARFRQSDGWLDVKQLTMGMAAASEATFCVETAATGFEIEGGRVKAVLTSRGKISCNSAVIAAGPFSSVVAKMAGVELGLELRIRQKLVMPEVPEVPARAPMTIDEDTGAHWRPAGRGAYLLFTQHDSPAGPPLDNVPSSADFYFGLLNPASATSVARIAPFWRTVWERNTDLWFLMAGQYSYTPDHKPFLGPSPVEGLFLNCGYSGHGIMGSAGGSRRVVDSITGKLKPEQNPFRFGRPLEPRTLDVL